MAQLFGVIGALAGVSLGAAWWTAEIDVREDPPAVICPGGWVTACERVPGGLELTVHEAPDLLFSFEGLSSEPMLGYAVRCAASPEPLGLGEGTFVPLSAWPQAETVTFYALSGELDWAEVSAVATASADGTVDGESPRGTSRSVSMRPATAMVLSAGRSGAESEEGGFPLYGPGEGTMTLTVVEPSDEEPSDEEPSFETVTVAGLTASTGQPVSRPITSLEEIEVKGEFPSGVGRFGLSASGYLHVGGAVTFRAGADDTASVKIGEHATSSIGGEHPLRWGNWATASGNFLKVEAAFGSVGGPYEFKLEGIQDKTLYKVVGYIPFAELEVVPAAVEVPWDPEAELTGTVTYAPKDGRVSYNGPSGGNDIVSLGTGGYTVHPVAFWLAGAQPTTVTFTASQSYDGMTKEDSASVTVTAAPTSLTFDPGVVTVTNAETIPAEGKGEHDPLLRYELSAPSGGVVSVEGLTATAGATVEALRAECLQKNLSTNVSWSVSVPWKAYYGSAEVASGEAPLKVTLEMKAKAEECECDCAEGTQTDNACVSFRQAFGRTPLVAGLPVGRLAIQESNLSDALFTPAALRYDHPMMRRLDVGTRSVTDPMGETIVYGRDGRPTSTSVAENSRLEALPDGTFRERFADRSAVDYAADGTVAALISTAGVRVPVDALGITVTRDAQGAIASIVSEADGTLEVTQDSATAYRVAWRDTEGNPVKTFAFSKEGDATLALMDGPFPVRWTWQPEAHDFALTRGAGAEAATVTRTVVYDGAEIGVTRTVSRGGTVAAESTQTIDSANGNAVVGSTSGGRTTLAATRVTEGNGKGRTATRTDALGATTSYGYDAEGRTLWRETVGATTNRVDYVYSADPFDRRPWQTTERVNGIVTREATFSDVELLGGGRVETTTDCGLTTVRAFWPADADDRFQAGRLRAELRPNGRMTTYDYDGATRVETVTEGVADAQGNMVLVSGKSTRTLTTYDTRGNAARIEREAYIGETWVPLTWEERTYSAAHKHLGSVWSNGKSSDSRWNCTGPIWEIGTDGVLTTNVYDSLKQRVSSTRHGPHGTLTTTYAYDAAGRTVRTVRGELASEKTYDLSGRVLTETDEQGRVTAYAYPDEWTTVATFPGGGTRVTTVDAEGRVASVTGTAATPEYHTYGPNWSQITYGTPNGARWVRTETDGLGRVVRETRSGANGSALETVNTYNAKGQLVRVERTGQAAVTYAYDAWGDVIATRVGDRVPQERTQAYVLVEEEPWQETVTTVSNLVQRVRVDAEGERQVSTDVRGNETETVVEEEGAWRTVTTTFPGVGNPSVEVALDGVTVQTVSASCVTNSVTYDVYRRPITQTDGRGNVTTRTYDALGRLASVTDAAGAVTAYAYDAAGRVAAVTNALGNVTVYDYDLRGNRTYEGGATYPVAYDYDAFGQKVSMTTFRDETSDVAGDTTTWAYDEATGALLSKTYADGRGVAYTLTDLGQVATRTDARGIVTTYAYNVYGDLVSQTYSDATPTVTYAYDALGRQAQATDAVGTTTFGYNAYGELETEAISGLYAKTLTHHFDAYGRNVGYSVNGSRRTFLGYDGDTGRIAAMNEGGDFHWEYLPGSDLKARLTYPNGLTAEWAYEPERDLLTAVTNSLPNGTTLSAYVYTNDLLGRRTSKNDEQYGYNVRDELTSANERTYAYDDIGNRTTAEGRSYTANNLNQYTAIDGFVPTFDADGNQTKVLTETGEWTVEYNAENRPIRWTQGNKVITMGFDRMGRRVFYKEMEGNRQITHTVFLYDGYLCIQQLFSNSPWNVYKEFIWDPTEPLATRPLCFRQYGQRSAFLLHDGNKNVTDVVTVGPFNEPVAHYDYAPFGAVTATGARALTNPFRFSSEFHDDTLALVYYNYRHYNPKDGRWLGRDPMEEEEGVNLFAFNYNNPSMYDRLGLSGSSWVLVSQEPTRKLEYKCASPEGCTLESLASIVGLDSQEFKGWASDVKEGTSDPNRFCEAKVPNTVLKFWAGDLGWFGRKYTAWRSPTSSLSVDYFVEDVIADEETSEEFLYDTTMRALAKQKELIGTLFMGHGDSKGWLYNGKDRKMAAQITGLPYKLKFAEIRACYSNKNKLKDGVLNYTGYDGMLLPMPFCNGGGVDW